MKIFQAMRSITLVAAAALVAPTGLAQAVTAAPSAAVTRCARNPTTPAGWQALFRQLPRAGDGALSTLLPDGRIAWIFGDTARLDSHDFIHNMVVFTCGTQIQQLGTAEAIPNQADGSYYWGGPAVVDGGKLYMMAPHVKASDSWPYFAALGTDMASFNVGTAVTPAFTGFAPTPSTGRAGGVQWGTGVMATGGYVYIYGAYLPAGAWGYSVRVARVPSGHLATMSAWRFWDGHSWGTSEPAATDIISSSVDGTDSAFSVQLEGGKVVITTKRGGAFSADVGQFVSAQPTGPFTWTPRANVPTTELLHTYLAADHPETGLRLITVNQQPQGRAWPDDVWANPDDYRPLWLGY
ncbi:MAG TPA: DUF4185 domain-containing protein [Candidatus Saccharimonadia bacterium]|nr:DUF4185 domain-containing protein [Candidatus Saccharimonadia bacterium]